MVAKISYERKCTISIVAACGQSCSCLAKVSESGLKKNLNAVDNVHPIFLPQFAQSPALIRHLWDELIHQVRARL